MDFEPLQSLSLKAPAKINLTLRVLGQRADGYHELETWMQKIDLCDEIVLQLREVKGISLRCTDSTLPADNTNLAWRAAEAFYAASSRGLGGGVDILLVKRIPAAAGLGGGSSDAGAVLRGLNALFAGEFSGMELQKMALSLGADVPFFATELDAVLATGVGEDMRPVPSFSSCSFLLVNPGFPVSTRWVFENFALTRGLKKSRLPGSFSKSADCLSLSAMMNDLESVTIARYPELAKIKETLLESGADRALMSGSGPTVFGIFLDSSKNQAELSGIAENLRRKYGERVFVTRSQVGASPSGKAPGFDPGIRRFESFRPSH